jgi:hypothetical protein
MMRGRSRSLILAALGDHKPRSARKIQKNWNRLRNKIAERARINAGDCDATATQL